MSEPKEIICKKEKESPPKIKTSPQKSEECETCGLMKASQTEVDEKELWALGKSRYVQVSEFLGDVYVNLRCFYHKNNALHPSRAGIALTMEQWDNLKSFLGEINKTIEAKTAEK